MDGWFIHQFCTGRAVDVHPYFQNYQLPLLLMASLTWLLRGQKLISPGSGKVKPHPVSCPFIPAYLEAMIESGLWHTECRSFTTFGKRIIREKELHGSWGQEGFCLCIWKPLFDQWIEKSVSHPSLTLLSRAEDGLGRHCERDSLCEAGRESFWLGTEEGGWIEECYVLVTQFLSTSYLGPCNHTQSWQEQNSIRFPELYNPCSITSLPILGKLFNTF